MAHEPIEWPKKTREIQDDTMDSRRWHKLDLRDGDIIIASCPKSGTTWIQQIVAQLLFEGEDVAVNELSPWLEFTLFSEDEVIGGLDRQTGRRFIKTHLPVDALGISPRAKYIYVARDGRDSALSLQTFLTGFGEQSLIRSDGTRVTRSAPAADMRQFFNQWLDSQAQALSPFFPHVQGWWNIRHLPNVLLVHYNTLKADMVREIKRIAAFLDIAPGAEAWAKILDHCGFDYMKAKAGEIGPKGASRLKGGRTAFFHKGTNGRWKDALSSDDIARYERTAAENLTPDCAHWLKTGELPA